MTYRSFVFGRFVLDPQNRQLTRDGASVELNNRYLDALILLVREQGRLVSKDRFLEVVWKGVPVTDEVITQCIKMLRKQLGDDASNPCFIETVPKHGYRFIAPVMQRPGSSEVRHPQPQSNAVRQFCQLVIAGLIGGGVAGVFGGLLYGFVAASQTIEPGTGAISVLLVVLCMTILIAVIGGAGVGFGIAASAVLLRGSWFSFAAGGAAGGLIVGAIVKLIGVDAFNLLFGRSPGDITGAAEGMVLGAAVGICVWLVSRTLNHSSIKRAIAVSALTGASAGVCIALLNGRLMVGSLDLLVRQFSGSRLRLDQIGHLFGEDGFGQTTQMVTGALEGALFAVSIAAAVLIIQIPAKATS